VYKFNNIITVNTLTILVKELRIFSFEILPYILKNKILFYHPKITVAIIPAYKYTVI